MEESSEHEEMELIVEQEMIDIDEMKIEVVDLDSETEQDPLEATDIEEAKIQVDVLESEKKRDPQGQPSSNFVHQPDPPEIQRTYFFCEFCSLLQTSADDLEKHKLAVHKQQSEIKLIQMSFRKVSSQQTENATSKKSKTYSCTKCKYKTSDHGEYQGHQTDHSAHGQYVCIMCYATFAQSEALRIHIMEHTGEAPYWCNRCEFKTRDKRELTKHLWQHPETDPLQCPFCSFKAESKAFLREHKRMHRPHLCEHCGARFKRAEQLKCHMVHHTGERRYPCSQCDFRAKHSHHLTRHVRDVHGQKQERKRAAGESSLCDICGKEIPKVSMANHKVVHSDERNFPCEHCDFKAKRKQHLQKHIRKYHSQDNEDEDDFEDFA